MTGLVAGLGGAIYYSVQTGRDFRGEYEQLRADLQERDFDALAGHLEERFKELQAGLEERLAEARETAQGATEDVAEAVETAAEEVEVAADEATTV
jgi:hypothetical protein